MAAMPYLLDTNVLLRLAKHDDADHVLVKTAIAHLIQAGAQLCYTSQNVVEFWNVFTRPKDKNGFGLTIDEADKQASLLEKQFSFLPDNERIHGEWRKLIVVQRVSGVQVHDARLVAAMRVHGVTHFLTLNKADFLRYRDINVVHPRDLGAPQI